MKHTEIASELFSKRYYCSQAVLAAFAEELGMTKEQALRVGACFGGGMCKAEVCGACTGALMALGLKYGMCEDGDYESKQRANSYTVRFLDEFAKQNGSYICRELLDCDISTDDGKAYARANGLFAEKCPEMIESAVLIAEKLINE
ncbi:MAG: C_GCAxxG_C_C family protein [Ruminococcus sp.]|nr:C_GCAxxG_C_C family protein [Ruminococcus sp.]